MRTLLQPRVEARGRLRLARDIDRAARTQITIDLVRDAVDVALPGAGDRRLADRRLGHRVHRHRRRQRLQRPLVVGTRRAQPLDELEPRDVEMSLTINGEERSAGNGAACLGDPLEALRWLAVQAARFGDPLRAGPPDPVRGPGPVRAVRRG